MSAEICATRDIFIERITEKMAEDKTIFFVAADFGSPKLDALKEKYPDRFLNVGIAEQNLINVSTGLALEGFKVFAYAIAPFITMRCFEQIRVNLAILSQKRPMNVNLIGVGAGYSYEMSGPTHQSLEDLSIMRTLPNVELFSPSEWMTAKAFVDYALENQTIKYLRFDSKPLPALYTTPESVPVKQGFHAFQTLGKLCLVSTGYMTHSALEICDVLKEQGIEVAVVDLFLLNPLDEAALAKVLASYSHIFTMEEGFINRGGLDSLISVLIREHRIEAELTTIGLEANYSFELGGREILHKINGMDQQSIIDIIKAKLQIV